MNRENLKNTAKLEYQALLYEHVISNFKPKDKKKLREGNLSKEDFSIAWMEVIKDTDMASITEELMTRLPRRSRRILGHRNYFFGYGNFSSTIKERKR